MQECEASTGRGERQSAKDSKGKPFWILCGYAPGKHQGLSRSQIKGCLSVKCTTVPHQRLPWTVVIIKKPWQHIAETFPSEVYNQVNGSGSAPWMWVELKEVHLFLGVGVAFCLLYQNSSSSVIQPALNVQHTVTTNLMNRAQLKCICQKYS